MHSEGVQWVPSVDQKVETRRVASREKNGWQTHWGSEEGKTREDCFGKGPRAHRIIKTEVKAGRGFASQTADLRDTVEEMSHYLSCPKRNWEILTGRRYRPKRKRVFFSLRKRYTQDVVHEEAFYTLMKGLSPESWMTQFFHYRLCVLL